MIPITLTDEQLGKFTRELARAGHYGEGLAALIRTAGEPGGARRALEEVDRGESWTDGRDYYAKQLLERFIAEREKAHRASRFCHICATFSESDRLNGVPPNEWTDVGGSMYDGDYILDEAMTLWRMERRDPIQMMRIESLRDGTMWTWTRSA